LKTNVIVLVLALCVPATAWPPRVKGRGNVDNIQTVDVIASRFKFEPAIITVTQGDSVRLRLHSSDRTHGIAIKAFRIKAPIPQGGQGVTVEFVADQAGTFDFTCSEYCGTGHGGMKGSLVVVAREK
jgi:cytochrome c oxidase subunit 2